MAVNGTAVAAIAAGGLFLWSGIRGVSVLAAIQNIVRGTPPAAGQNYEALSKQSTSLPVVPESSGTAATDYLPPGSGTSAANEALGRFMAAGYGWATGQQWQALNYGWGTLESGWRANATNSSSGAYGIPQAYGHGTDKTQGTQSNMFGPINGMTFPNSLYVAANSGSAAAQIMWGLKYIKLQYGSPAQVPGWLGQSNGYGGY